MVDVNDDGPREWESLSLVGKLNEYSKSQDPKEKSMIGSNLVKDLRNLAFAGAIFSGVALFYGWQFKDEIREWEVDRRVDNRVEAIEEGMIEKKVKRRVYQIRKGVERDETVKIEMRLRKELKKEFSKHPSSIFSGDGSIERLLESREKKDFYGRDARSDPVLISRLRGKNEIDTENKTFLDVLSVVYSPDNSRGVFLRKDDGPFEIVVFNTKGNLNRKEITPQGYLNFSGIQWEDNDTIVFRGKFDGPGLNNPIKYKKLDIDRLNVPHNLRDAK